MRKRAVLAASLALTPMPVANAYGWSRDARTQAAQHQAAMTAAAQNAADRSRVRDLPYVPAPPTVNLVQGYAPGLPAGEAMGTAAFDSTTNTLYYQGKLDPATRAHETGHALDHQVLSDGDRVFFQKLMHAPARVWRSGTGLQGLTSPSEWFADYYAASALHLDPTRQNEAAYAQIGPKRLKRFEAALARLGKRHQLKQYL